jgi:transcriptional regulator with PAS, ATPase and Fis domain
MNPEKHPRVLIPFLCSLSLSFLVVALLPRMSSGQQTVQPKRVMVLYWYGRDFAGNIKFDESFQSVLQTAPSGSIEYYPEYFDTKRFPGENQAQLLFEYLKQKYEGIRIDVVVTASDVALDFFLRYRKELFPTAPIVFTSVKRPTVAQLAEGAGITGTVHVNSHRKTIDLAIGLHPGTEHVFVVSGTLEHDKRYEKIAREELDGYEKKVDIKYLTDLPPDQLIETFKTLPEKSVVLYVWEQALDAQGKVLESIDVLRLISRTAPVPIYGLSSANIGAGLIGGDVYILESRGARTAEMVLRLTAGERAQDIPIESAPTVPMFDWQQLRRWNIDEERLPLGSIIRFRAASFWELYKGRIMVGIGLMALEAVLIGFLLLERKKRQQSATELQKSEEHFRLLFENSRDAILISDDEGRYLQVNQAACDLLGRSREDIVALNPRTLIGEDSSDQGEFSFVRPDGDSRTALYSTSGFAPHRRLSILRDITERNQSELSLRHAFSEIEQLKEQLQAENLYLQEEIELQHNFDEIVGSSTELKYVLYKVEQVAPADTTVLLLGETGTGKELVARAIHRASERRDRAMVKVSCAALPATLIESELFGHEKGAFTGATGRKVGRFELANDGTLFLDEIGEMPLEVQSKLLRVLQEGEFERVGGSKTIKVNARIIAATNRNLKTEVRNGMFREDLWYRLSVFPISLPPLRSRAEDIPVLVNHFSNAFSKKLGKPLHSVAPGAMKALQEYSWPGNVRELANVIERAVINAQGPVLYLADKLDLPTPANGQSGSSRSLAEIERDVIIERLEASQWRIEGDRGAAKSLGMNPSTLRSRMQKLGIQPNNKDSRTSHA